MAKKVCMRSIVWDGRLIYIYGSCKDEIVDNKYILDGYFFIVWKDDKMDEELLEMLGTNRFINEYSCDGLLGLDVNKWTLDHESNENEFMELQRDENTDSVSLSSVGAALTGEFLRPDDGIYDLNWKSVHQKVKEMAEKDGQLY